MEVVGGFMVLLSIVGFFLTVIWFILPFVIFAIKGKVDRTEEQLQALEGRLATIEGQLSVLVRLQHASHAPEKAPEGPVGEGPPPPAGE